MKVFEITILDQTFGFEISTLHGYEKNGYSFWLTLGPKHLEYTHFTTPNENYGKFTPSRCNVCGKDIENRDDEIICMDCNDSFHEECYETHKDMM